MCSLNYVFRSAAFSLAASMAYVSGNIDFIGTYLINTLIHFRNRKFHLVHFVKIFERFAECGLTQLEENPEDTF